MQDQDRTPRVRVPMASAGSLVITVGALGLMALHLLSDESPVDTVAIGLFALAIAPWLAPLLSKLELPGGWKFEFKELRREVAEGIQEGARKVESLESRMRSMEQFAFSGALSSDQQKRLNEALGAYDQYLRDVGLSIEGELPVVHIFEGVYDNAHYEPVTRRIVIGQDLVEDDDVMFREYAHHVLIGETPEASSAPLDAIESGLADYYPCSFKGSPVFAPRVAVAMWEIWGLKRPYIRNLRNAIKFADLDTSPGPFPPQRTGEVWGGAFWDLRQAVGPELADRALAAAWKSVVAEPRGAASAARYVDRVVQSVRDQGAAEKVHTAQACFEKRGQFAARQ